MRRPTGLVLILLTFCLLTLCLGACTGGSGSPSHSPSPAGSGSGSALTVDTSLTDAPVTDPSQLHDNGHTFDVYDSIGNASGLALSKAGMTHGAPVGLNAASYFETKLSAPPSRIQADVVFAGGANSGAVTLVDWLNSIKAQHAEPGGQPSQGSFHVTFTPQFVRIGVYQQATHTVQIIKAVTFTSPLSSDGSTAEHISLTRSGDTVTVTVPGNPAIVATSDQFTKLQGDWACWELYEQRPGQVPAHITSIGAG